MTPPAATEYRDKILYALAVIATLGVTPFSIANLLNGYYLIGALSLLVVLVLAIDAYAISRGRRPPLPLAVAFSFILVGIVIAIWQRGVMSVFWAFPAILLFHFVLERRVANAFNLILALVVAVAVWPALEPDFTLRILVALLLTIAFANVFSYAVEAEQRREREQRRRLDLLARATQAGFFEWERHHNVARYSERLKEMLGYAANADTSGWPPFHEFIHPEDREPRVKLFRQGARSRGKPGDVLRHVPGQNRLLHKSGETILVRTEGLFIYGADGRATRYIAAMYDVSELHRKAEELSRAIHVREEVERIARHDLKTPLNSILSVPAMLRGRRRLDREEEELLGMVEGAAYRMLDMVNLSIDLYRMEQGQYRFSPRAVDLGALVDTVWREIRAHADSKALRLDKRVQGRGLAWGEQLLCYSILANLLKNAVEAAPEESVVTIEILEAGSRATVSVHNLGAVPESMRERFFQKYASAGKAGGHGLGAYSARLMSRVQQGELSMHTAEASGTTLTLTLPAAQAAEVPAAHVEVRKPAAPLPPLRVLVVDDDEFNVLFMRANLPSPPLAVEAAINGRAALEAARARPPDLVFMDLEMPVMDGFEALAGLRRQEAAAGGKPATVIAFSSFDDEATRRRCLEAGFDGYLTKPAPRERIHELIARAAGVPVAEAVVVDPELESHLPAFVASRKALVDELAGALAGADRAAARRLAHKLAGSLSLYGFHWAAGEARAIHGQAESGELAALAPRCRELRNHLERYGKEEKAAARR